MVTPWSSAIPLTRFSPSFPSNPPIAGNSSIPKERLSSAFAPAVSGAAGVCSIVYFVGLVCGLSPYVTLIVSGLVCAALVKWVRLPANEVPSKPPARWLLIVFLMVLAGAVAIFILTAFKEPHGYWDAWSIWNLHARFMARGGAHWTDMFTTQIGWTQPDYPLLVPSIVAQAWSVLRSEATFIPAAIAFLFTFGTAAVVVGVVRMLRGWDQALIAGAFLLGTATFLLQGVAQYADIPLAFYMAAALALFCFDDVKCTVLAGAMAGFAAWTKNEGLLFIVVLVVARCIVRLRNRTAAKLFVELKWFAAGLAPVLAVVALFKFRYAPPGDLLTGKPGEILGHLVDFGRWVTVIEGFMKHLFVFGSPPTFIVPVIIVLAVFAFLVRFRADPDRRTAVHTMIVAVVLMLLGDFAVYLLLSNRLDWLIDTSLDRILMQLWPAALLAFFAAAGSVQLAPVPEKTPHKEPKKDAKKAAATRRRS